MVGFAVSEGFGFLAVEVEGDFVVGDDVAVGAEGGEVGAFFGVAEGEFPEAFAAGVVAGGEEDLVVFEPEEGVFGDFDEGFARLFDGEGFGGVGLAEVFDGAEEAGGVSRGADGLAEFHEGGVEGAGGFLIEEGFRGGPDDFLTFGGVDGFCFVEEAGDDAGDVSIDDGGWLIEGEATDGTSSVFSDAGEGEELSGVGGEGAVEVRDYGLSGALEVPDAIVVSESFPGAEDFSFGGLGDALDGGEFVEEFFETLVCDDGGDGGLLKHDFRD